MYRKVLLVVVMATLVIMFFGNCAYVEEVSLRPYSAIIETQETWFRPFPVFQEEQEKLLRLFLVLRGVYDDNIFLTPDDEKTDWITTISPGFIIQPLTTKHKFTLDYRADLNYFADYDEQNFDDHTANATLKLIFNNATLDLANMYHYFSERAGWEDVEHVPRTQDHASAVATFDFNKLDLSLGYRYRFEDYRSNAAIGSFKGLALTYQDLDRIENVGEIEAALKKWPKTSLLLSGGYGTIDHDTGNKSDSDYLDLLVGLRGQPTAKCTVEGKVGYREQDYENYDDDFESIVFNGSLVENFTTRDVFRLDFLRATDDTNFLDNAYYAITFFGAGYKHGFTDKIFGNLNCYYQLSRYPTEVTLLGKTAKREDDFWSYSVGLGYELPKNFTVNVIYEYKTRESNFDIYDYENNIIGIGITAYK